VSDAELEGAKRQLRREHAQQLQSTLARALMLGEYAAVFRDPGMINTLSRRIEAVTKADLQRAAQLYYKDTNRTVVVTMPKAGSRP